MLLIPQKSYLGQPKLTVIECFVAPGLQHQEQGWEVVNGVSELKSKYLHITSPVPYAQLYSTFFLLFPQTCHGYGEKL